MYYIYLKEIFRKLRQKKPVNHWLKNNYKLIISDLDRDDITIMDHITFI